MASFKEIINKQTPVLVDVYADWCGPCKQLAPTIQSVKNKLGKQAKVIKVDIDKNQAFASQHGIQSVPTLMIFQNGELKWKQSGVLPEHEIIRKLEELMQ